MAIEGRRGCGYRKVGGLYLVGSGEGIPCCKLPVVLHICPTCGGGVKQTRGWTWIDPKPWFANKTCSQPAYLGGGACIAATPEAFGERVGLLWIGTAFYPTPGDFLKEANAMGISRRITAVPRGFKVGEHWVFFAHPKVQKLVADGTGEESWLPGVFRIFKPQRIEKIITETMSRDEALMTDLAEKGITPVIVPDGDRDHQGSVYDDASDDQAVLPGVVS